MVSFMTLQNSMDERKLKNYQAFHLSLLSSMSVYVCVCVRLSVCVGMFMWFMRTQICIMTWV